MCIKTLKKHNDKLELLMSKFKHYIAMKDFASAMQKAYEVQSHFTSLLAAASFIANNDWINTLNITKGLYMQFMYDKLNSINQ